MASYFNDATITTVTITVPSTPTIFDEVDGLCCYNVQVYTGDDDAVSD